MKIRGACLWGCKDLLEARRGVGCALCGSHARRRALLGEDKLVVEDGRIVGVARTPRGVGVLHLKIVYTHQ